MALMQRMTKLLWGIGKIVIMDSGICVIKGLIGMFWRGFYGITLMKKCIYWPTGIYGDETNAHCEKNM